ncbi:dTDP-4-dehydrorhamnose reductase [Flavobacterium branchiophilum NBRC 15030 = ATCC 35035]|uniref:dTDP-4-dehydrorhamnose reductase n=1 Tax=Flavobacterium branchiophilum TaxID=55197 RepID=A0A543G2L5_9FLAO|nr:dTDP-4-dehydrorhamnose reductase [Flavobacterium branchiophilum]OXA79194.1 dTDP-4-dehydrorhamnose reductase [Flavobacterium branchiophilum NBRC 15030 = ATCC 35035]TQM40322.1 dTDP-4-dehydrorhamnose reductase [Flavobacterium branchiophilum]GEM56531.1 NAD(P)-dependent oxidoreductase [Flavobacterium branchiophilum NBRC 15030 = ATCC 35035]
MVVLVTGANGQLGQSMAHLSVRYAQIDFVFCDSKQMNITDFEAVKAVFKSVNPDVCINTAAYTAVDKAESDQENAIKINVKGAQNLALVCKEFHTKLIHVSTDFVFDGQHQKPYTEIDIPKPTGVYGQTKLDGELAIAAVFSQYYIVRTSWVYSQFGNNFMKTMLRLGAERDTLSVVEDQIGTPTHALDLADALIQMALFTDQNNEFPQYGIYHFSNEGQCSWFDFAQKIFEIHQMSIDVKPIPTQSYPTPAKRPAYSVLDKTKIKTVLGITIKNWDDRLKETIL